MDDDTPSYTVLIDEAMNLSRPIVCIAMRRFCLRLANDPSCPEDMRNYLIAEGDRWLNAATDKLRAAVHILDPALDQYP